MTGLAAFEQALRERDPPLTEAQIVKAIKWAKRGGRFATMEDLEVLLFSDDKADGGKRREMSEDRMVFSSALSNRIRSDKLEFTASDDKLRDELASKYAQLGGKVSSLRVHPDIKQFCSKFWDEQTRRLQFESKQSYDACSREIVRRDPWILFCRGAAGEFERFDIDVVDRQGFAGRDDE